MKDFIFERRENNFWNLMAKNAEIETLTKEQHNTLAKLANLRHELHTNHANLFNAEAPNHELWDAYDEINDALASCGLETIDLPDRAEDFVSTIDYDIDNEGLSYSDWYEKYFDIFGDEMEEVNKKIEAYLEAIDQKHGTKYAPTGMTRIY